jgi:hypothetical protein
VARDEDCRQDGEEKVRRGFSDRRFERKYLDTKLSEPVVEPNPQVEPLSEFEKQLENRKHSMLKDIHYDVRKLDETESRLKSVSEIMTLFSQKVVEQGMVTEQSRLSDLRSCADGCR